MLCLLLQCSRSGKLRSATAVVGFFQGVGRAWFVPSTSTCTRHAAPAVARLVVKQWLFHGSGDWQIYSEASFRHSKKQIVHRNSSQKLDESTNTKESNVGLCIYRLVKVCQTMKEMCIHFGQRSDWAHMSKFKTSHVGPRDVCLQIFHWSCDIVKDVNMSFSHFSTCRVEAGGGRTPHFQPFKPTLRKSSWQYRILHASEGKMVNCELKGSVFSNSATCSQKAYAP